MDADRKRKLMDDFVGKFVLVCARCGRGIIGKESQDAIIDSQPIWWLRDPEDEAKMIEGPRCDGRIMRRERIGEIERLNAQEIVPASEVYVLPAGRD